MKLKTNNNLSTKNLFMISAAKEPFKVKGEFRFMDIKGISKLDVLEKFIDWYSVPTPFRKPKTLKEFAKLFCVSPDTLTDWRKRKGFFDEVGKNFEQWRQFTSDVCFALLQACKRGNVSAIKLWFEWFEHFEGFSGKQQVIYKQEVITEVTPEQKRRVEDMLKQVALPTIMEKNK